MNYTLLADIVVTVHLTFVLFVLITQLLIVVGGFAGWSWVRNFWFRVIHLLSIGVVAMQAVAGIECPLTTWERQLRGGKLHNLEGASDIGRFCNGILYVEIYKEDLIYFLIGYAIFFLMVLLTWILVQPRWPWARKQPDRPLDGRLPAPN